MSWDTEPPSWLPQYLRSQVFNDEVRDRQRHLFKRPREQVTINSGTFTPTTSWSLMDANNLYVEIETTGRPLLAMLSGSMDANHGGVAVHPVYFDLRDNYGRYASALGGKTQLAEGAYQYNMGQNVQSMPLQAWFYIDWLTEAGVYKFYPMWLVGGAGMTIPTSTTPLDFIVEEL